MEPNGFIVDVQTTFEIDGQKDTMQVTCPAYYEFTPGLQTVLYDDFNDDATVNTCMTVGDGVDIIRNGGTMMGLHLRIGERVSDRYTLDFGMVLVEYEAEEIAAAMTPEGGVVELRYYIDMGGVPTRNHVVITIRRAE